MMIVVDSDFSALEGTNCYCAEESASQIRAAVAELPVKAFHRIGTGDYHYMSLFWLERISEPFELILFDNHPDDQAAAFGGDMLSCGGWVADARRLPFLKNDCWIQREDDISRLDALDPDYPVYISIDIDVLSPEYAHTDWSQGDMTLPVLVECLERIKGTRRILGVDLCGGLSESKGAVQEDFELNEGCFRGIIGAFD